MIRHLLLPAMLTLALGACSVGPEYRRPEPPEPAAWKADPAARAAAPVSLDWWRSYGSPELSALVAAAEIGNTDIAAAAARVLQAQTDMRIAGSSLLPAVNASADVSRQRSGGTAGRSTTGSRYNVGVAASYEIDFWGKNRAAAEAAQAATLASRYAQDTIRLTVVSDIATTYVQVLQLRERLAVARANLEIAERVLAVVLARVDAGAASQLEAAQQRTSVANQRAAIPSLQQAEAQAVNSMAILLGVTPASVGIAATGIDGLTLPAIAPGLPSDLLARRPDIRQAEALLVSANADIRAARAALYPSIDLTGQYGFASTALSTLLDPVSRLWSLAAGLSQVVLDGGRLSAQAERSEARYEELLQTYRRAVVSAFTDVENALVSIRLLAEQEAVQQEAVNQARLAASLAETRYRAGAIDLLAVLDAQRSLFQAEDQRVQLRSSRLQASIDLYRALGGGWTAGS